MNLRRKGRALDDECLIAQRIKRLSSIEHKLSRFPSMKLSQMQDIGGCRAILKDVKLVNALVSDFKSSDIKHKLSSEDDYIISPKTSGYRGIHLVYRYFSDRKETYNDLKIELQIRSQLQHAWATSVEVVGTLIRQALKSSQGEDDWLQFFRLMGSAIAIEEGCGPVPNTPKSEMALSREIRKLARTLRPIQRLDNYSKMIQVVEKSAKRARYYLLELRPDAGRLSVTGYMEAASKAASDDYLKVERSLSADDGDEAVLVSVDSIDALRKTYPNYFLDTTVFTNAVRRWVGP
ncbi:RelA/SpoT domain-containing protein [Novosphingobium sp. PS1R-30]|uniref:RelA/SpoT domain-containing protein n=1 Tax=Novosphingobium anseongense TaxID=3133436 RepID=A0ABU8RUU6_9SPHN